MSKYLLGIDAKNAIHELYDNCNRLANNIEVINNKMIPQSEFLKLKDELEFKIDLIKKVYIDDLRIDFNILKFGDSKTYFQNDIKVSISKDKIIGYVSDKDQKSQKIYKLKIVKGKEGQTYVYESTYDYYEEFAKRYHDGHTTIVPSKEICQKYIIPPGCNSLCLNILFRNCNYLIYHIIFDDNGIPIHINFSDGKSPQVQKLVKKEIDLSSEKNSKILKKLKIELMTDVMDFLREHDNEFQTNLEKELNNKLKINQE